MQRKSERVGGRNSGEGEHVRLRLAVNYLPFKYLTSTHAPIIPTKTPNQNETQNEAGQKKRMAKSRSEPQRKLCLSIISYQTWNKDKTN